MKIESGNNVFVLDFNGKANEEEKMFLEVANHMIDKKLGTVAVKESVIEIKPVIEDKTPSTPITQVIQKEQEDREAVKKCEVKPEEVTCQVVKPTVSNTVTKQSKQKFSSVKEYLESQERRLVVGSCECEKVYHFWVDNPDQKEVRFTCKRCEEDKTINLEDLVPATYKCEECGKQSSFWMEASQAVAIDCIGCNAEVDMYYHDKKQIMTNQF